ncbi:MAG: HAD family hydrolase [Candidatus Rokubacteria bacterium]|nr:HAD family hydrolase [Candidatus Rokubacteria bacterium]
MAYAAVLFDLFDTLVRFDRSRLPRIEVDGREVRSTAGYLHEILRPYAPGITVEVLYRALIESWSEAERVRALDHREVPARERFGHLFRCLELDPSAYPPDLMHALIEAHRRQLSKAAEFPPHYGPLLRALAGRFRLGVVSNFDYTPTAVGILEEAGVRDLFGAIVVSDEIGWRKPRPEIFEAALGRLDVRAEETLFVGDRIDIDVLGALRIGMDAAWVNPSGEPAPPLAPSPTFEIHDLADLGPLLTP